MAFRAQPINRFTALFGLAALFLVLLALLGPLFALWAKAPAFSGLTPYDWGAIKFTVFQAALSASISVALAIPLARALARRNFPGRSLVITLLGAPFLLPVIVAIFGLLAIWGRAGLVSQFLMFGGGERINIYGLSGILLAHVFFNLPLATRFILQGWDNIPAEHFRLTAQLGFSPKDTQKRLEWPMLKGVIPGAFLLIFLLCMTSFAVALALGGGPKATTIELAIFQAVRFDFDLGKAALLGLIQFGICAIVALFSIRIATQIDFGAGLSRNIQRWDVGSRMLIWQDRALIFSAVVFLGAPLVAIVLRGLFAVPDIPASTWPAAKNSILISLLSAGVAIMLALLLALFIDALKARKSRLSTVSEGLALLTLSTSPFVLGTGLFIVIHPLIDPFSIALPITAMINAMISLPFALRMLLPALAQNRRSYGVLADSLGAKGWGRFWVLVWPRLRKPLGFSTGLAAALSMGDLGVIALFAPPDVETLPLLMYRLMGAYRMEQAAGVGVILITLTMCMFWIFDRGGRYGNHS